MLDADSFAPLFFVGASLRDSQLTVAGLFGRHRRTNKQFIHALIARVSVAGRRVGQSKFAGLPQTEVCCFARRKASRHDCLSTLIYQHLRFDAVAFFFAAIVFSLFFLDAL